MIKKLTDEASIKEALQLVTEVFTKFQAPDYGVAGVASFTKFIDFEELFPQIQTGEITIYGDYDAKRLTGVLGIRNPSHICLLFVAEAAQRQGIAKKLVQSWLKEHSAELTTVTVNSSPYALAAYQKLGFTGDPTVLEADGIKYIPLTLAIKN